MLDHNGVLKHKFVVRNWLLIVIGSYCLRCSVDGSQEVNLIGHANFSCLGLRFDN